MQDVSEFKGMASETDTKVNSVSKRSIELLLSLHVAETSQRLLSFSAKLAVWEKMSQNTLPTHRNPPEFNTNEGPILPFGPWCAIYVQRGTLGLSFHSLVRQALLSEDQSRTMKNHVKYRQRWMRRGGFGHAVSGLQKLSSRDYCTPTAVLPKPFRVPATSLKPYRGSWPNHEVAARAAAQPQIDWLRSG
ncbi:hypothetical protein HD554DRAFT_1565385 [Boletus coccyginus]|nr:hypothetical protein HD554DRAFT_1565385 [Boletus coccyginus]